MYLSAGATMETGLGKSDPCAPNAALNGTLCGFNSVSSKTLTAVYVPPSAPKTDPVTILVWLHGDLIPCGDEGSDAISYVKSNTFPFARQISDAKLPYVLAVPTMKWNAATKVKHPLGSPAAMNAFVEEVRLGLTNAGWTKAPPLGRLILAGHSRAYVVLNALAAAVADPQSSLGALSKLTEVWLVDTTYGKSNPKLHGGKWITWAAAHAKAPSFIFLRVLYRKESDTAAVAERIRDEARKALLPNVLVESFPSHCSMPRDQVPTLLAASRPAKAQSNRPR